MAACGGELNAPSGTISSPNYPNLYPHSRVCRWELAVASGRRVTLTINDLRLEDSGTSCVFDYVDVSPVGRLEHKDDFENTGWYKRTRNKGKEAEREQN